MCGCECCISAKSIHSSLLSWRDRYLKRIKDQSQNAQSRRSGERAHILNLSIHFHTGNVYCNAVMTVHESIFLIKKFQINMTKLHPQLGFTFITSLDVVLLMVDFH